MLPIMPTVWPLAMCRLMPVRASRPLPELYRKETLSKSTLPSPTTVRALAGVFSVLSCWRTSTIRPALSEDMVIMTKTMESIIMEDRI